MDRGAWQGTVHRVAESDMTEATLHAHMHVSNKPQGYIVQHGEYSQCLVTTIDGA